MLISIFATVSSKKEKDRLQSVCDTNKVDELTCFPTDNFKDLKNARRLKSYWAARKDPFILVDIDKKPVKAFYTEASKDVIRDLDRYLKNKEYEKK